MVSAFWYIIIRHCFSSSLSCIKTLVQLKRPVQLKECMVWQNCIVRRKNAKFDTKMPSSTQKSPTQHASVNIAIIKHPPLLIEIMLPILFTHIFYKESIHKNKISTIQTVQQFFSGGPDSYLLLHNAFNIHVRTVIRFNNTRATLSVASLWVRAEPPLTQISILYVWMHLFQYGKSDNVQWLSVNTMAGRQAQRELCGTNFNENIGNLRVSC